MDHLLLVSTNLTNLQLCKDKLALEFYIIEHGPAQFCLSIHIHWHPLSRYICISQTKYIADMLHGFQMHKSAVLTIPKPAGLHLTCDDAPSTFADSNHMTQIPYRQAAG